jgi:hypothetical protein
VLAAACGCRSRELDIVSVRLIPLTKANDTEGVYDGVRNDPSKWQTTIPCGLACYERKNGQWLVFPFLKDDGTLWATSANYLGKIATLSIPGGDPAMNGMLQAGKTYTFRSIGEAVITIQVEPDDPLLGRISINCAAQGLEIRYSSPLQVLY